MRGVVGAATSLNRFTKKEKRDRAEGRRLERIQKEKLILEQEAQRRDTAERLKEKGTPVILVKRT